MPALSIDNILLDRAGPLPLTRQLYLAIRRLIEARAVGPGTELPSSRELATALGLGRNTVIAAIDQLALEGFVVARRKARPRVANLPEAAAGQQTSGAALRLSARGAVLAAQPYHHGRPGVQLFHPGLPDPASFPFSTWARLLARRARQAGSGLFGPYHVEGYPPLRAAIARYLTASRGVACRPEQVFVTNGAQAAFDLLARLLTDPGDPVWMEEPGYYGAAAAFTAAGARLLPLPVDDRGWRLDGLAETPRVVFVTPSCQHPLGMTMTMKTRLMLLSAADAAGAMIVEDDYDSEYRFQGEPIPALQGMARNTPVAFVGTFAKILFPAMRLGYLVVPPALVGPMTAALSTTGQFAPLVTQAALADFIEEGHLTRHLKRMRRVYGERRAAFLAAFDDHLAPWMQLSRTDTGIQMVARFSTPRDDRATAAAAAARGLSVSPLSMLYRSPDPPSGLLLGFSAAPPRDIRRGLERLADVVRQAD